MSRAGNSQNKTETSRLRAGESQATSAAKKIIEIAEVIDIILDPSHPDFSPSTGLVIGAVHARPLSRFNSPIENLSWYHPYFSNFYTQYPLIGENVLLLTAAGKANQKNPNADEKYYLPPINVFQNGNHNQNAGISINKPPGSSEAEDCNPSGQYTSNPGIEETDKEIDVALGKTFTEKEVIKLFPYEGDSTLEGRFGNSIRFGSTSKFADTPNYWSSEGLNGDAITIISNGHSAPTDSEFHLEDINRDSAVIMYCEGQLVPILVASELWDSYGVTFERRDAEQKALDFITDKEVQRHEENDEDEKEDTKDEHCEKGFIMDENGECVEDTEEEPTFDEETNTDVTGVVKKCWDADDINGNDDRKLLLKEMVDDLVSNGATPEGACAIIGNALSEGAGPICTSAASKDPGEAVKGALKNLEKWRQTKNGKPIVKSNQNGYWNGSKTIEKGGKKIDQECWCGVGAFEVDTVYSGVTYGPGQSSKYSRYSNWQGGVGIIQWTGTRRTKFEIALGVPAYNDGTGGYLWPKTDLGKNGGGKWKNNKLITPPTNIGITPKPHNRAEYNAAIINARYKGSKPGLNAQLVYAMEEMKTRNKDVYELVTTSRDIPKITFAVYAKYETPTSYIEGKPGGRNPNGISHKPKSGDTYKDYYEHSVKKRTENAENTYKTWQGFLFQLPVAVAVNTQTPTVTPVEILPDSRNDGYVQIELYKGFNILQKGTAEEEYDDTYDNAARLYYKVENSFIPDPGLDGIDDKQGFKDEVLNPNGGIAYHLQQNIRNVYSEGHDMAGRTFPRTDPFGPDGYIFAIKFAIDDEIEEFIEMEQI